MGSSERTTAGHDVDHDERMDVQAEIQDVLDVLQRELAGDSVDDVVVAINRRMADGGIPEQPHRWVQAMAERISTGRPVVADTAGAVDAVRLAESGGDDAGSGVGVAGGAPQDAAGNPAHDPTERTGGPAAGEPALAARLPAQPRARQRARASAPGCTTAPRPVGCGAALASREPISLR